MHIFETPAYNLILYLFMLNFMEIGMLIIYINLSFRGTQIYKLNYLECLPFGLPGLHRALTWEKKSKLYSLSHIQILWYFYIFTESALGPLRSSSRDVCLHVGMSPPHAIYFKASHWPSDHMISSRPVIGQPSTL